MTEKDLEIQELRQKLKEYEDTGVTPEDLKSAFDDDVILKLAGQVLGSTANHLRELVEAEKDGRLLILNEGAFLSIATGARAIEQNKKLSGATYCWDVFGECGGPKEITYNVAANILRNISEPGLSRESVAKDGES